MSNSGKGWSRRLLVFLCLSVLGVWADDNDDNDDSDESIEYHTDFPFLCESRFGEECLHIDDVDNCTNVLDDDWAYCEDEDYFCCKDWD